MGCLLSWPKTLLSKFYEIPNNSDASSDIINCISLPENTSLTFKEKKIT